MNKLIVCCLTILTLSTPSWSKDEIEISLKNASKSEAQTKEQLEVLLQRHDVSKWLFTRKILIEDNVIPHSHPVLTLSTRDRGDVLLATFVHEQIHWFLVNYIRRQEILQVAVQDGSH